jgi:high-affinity nickel-transport protein
MFGFVAPLHILGFGIFVVFVVPGHYKGLGIGVSVLAYTLGLRHVFNADHISAIDDTTRKLMNDRQDVADAKRPLSVGSFFSLGHSTVVMVIGAGLVVAEKALYGAVSNSGSGLEQFGGVFGTIVSASFLCLVALINIVVLVGIIGVYRSIRNGSYDEAELERQLNNRGLMFRFLASGCERSTRNGRCIPLPSYSAWASIRLQKLHSWQLRRCSRPRRCLGIPSCGYQFSLPQACRSWTRSTAVS